MNYLVCTIKPWNVAQYDAYSRTLPGEWRLMTRREELTIEAVRELNPRYIFFPHWSWIVPAPLVEGYECVCFHSSDVPHGRGGSPIQNLIIRGHQETKVSALRMTSELDAGPVYLKKPLSLRGPAQEIFERVAATVGEMIAQIVRDEPTPQPQAGESTIFKRRTEAENLLPIDGKLEDIYNHIRMLDAETYPASNLLCGNFKLSFRRAQMADGKLQATVEFEEVPRG